MSVGTCESRGEGCVCVCVWCLRGRVRGVLKVVCEG